MRWCAEDLGLSLRWQLMLGIVLRSIHATVLPFGAYGGTLPELRSESNT